MQIRWPLTKKVNPREYKKYTTMDLMPRTATVAKWTDYSILQAVRAAYKRSTWVYACISLRANNIATVPWLVERETSKGWERDDNHDIARLLKRPNESFDWATMIKYGVYLLDLSGDFYATKEKTEAGRIMSLWPLIPDSMTVVPGLTTLVHSYKYKKASITQDIPAEDIVHLKYPSPDSLYYGLAPLHAAARAVDIDEESEAMQKKSLQNGGTPHGLLTFDNIGQKEYDQALQWLQEQEASGKKHWVLGNGKWQTISQTAKELDFIASRQFIREEICAAFKVPPPLVGIYKDATLANIETAKKILWQEGLVPVLDEIKSQLNLQLIGMEDGIRINYDLSNITALQENFKDKVEAAKSLWGMGIPLKDINNRLGLGLDTTNMPGADVGYLPAGLLPADIDMDEFLTGGNEAGKTAYGKE